jgi:hypothetical protein
MATSVPAPIRNTKGDPPGREETRGNIQKPELSSAVALNFRVSAEFKRNFKIAAATFGLKQSELLRQAFDLWSQRHGLGVS